MVATGRTRVIAVVGHPIESARAPEALGRTVAELGLDIAVVPADVGAEGLPAFVLGARTWRNLAGLVVTMPHKAAIAPLIDRSSPRAAASGTVNVVRRDADGLLAGDQTDGDGLVRSLRDTGLAVEGSVILLLGAGGVARSIAFALADSGAARLIVANRSREPADLLVADLRRAHEGLDAAVGYPADAGVADILVNATSVGSGTQPGLPIEPDLIRPGSVVADVIAKPATTELLEEAARRGARTLAGVRMQEAQLRTILAFVGGDPEGTSTESWR